MKKRSIFIYIVLLAAVIGIGCFGAYHYFFGTLQHDSSFADAVDHAVDRLSVNEQTDLNNANIKNIAIFGIDSQDSSKGRSDATMILSIDRVHNKIKLCSIARDTLVYIPDKDVYEKFTHAYAYGGAELAVKTLNKNFNLNITDYVAVNFSEMASIVDMLGGVQVNLSEAEIPYLGECGKSLTAGDSVTLNGEQAVSYSRIRHLDSDDMRTSRQREVMASLFSKAGSLSITQYPSLIRQGLGLCTTSLDYSEIFNLAQFLLTSKPTFEQDALPGNHVDAWGGIMLSSHAWCYVYDLREASDYLLSFIYEDIYTHADIQLPAATVDKSFIK